LNRNELNRSHLQVLVSAVLYGYIIVGGRVLSNLGLSLIEIALLPLALSSLVLLLFRPSSYRSLFTRSGFYGFALFGLIGAALQLTQYGGIVLGVPVAVVAVLLYMQPVWTVLLSRLIHGERITRRKLAALGLALAGMLILLNPYSPVADYSFLGMASSFLAGWVLAAWVIWAKKIGTRSRITAANSVAGYSIFTVIFLAAVHAVDSGIPPGNRFGGLQPDLWLTGGPAILSVAMFAYLIPGLLFFSGITRTSASTAGLLLMLEPVSAAFLAAIWFGEPISWNIALGGVLILVSNGVILGKISSPVADE